MIFQVVAMVFILIELSGSAVVLQPSLHGHSADAPPAAVQGACGLLDGVTLSICGTGIAVMQQYLTQVQHRSHTCAVLLYVPLQLLNRQHVEYDIREYVISISIDRP